MRHIIKDFVSLAVNTLPIKEPIFEFGSLQVVPGLEEFADLRPLFPNTEYIGCDMRQGPGVDRILDLHHIEMPQESVGTVLCLDTLEHVEYPHTALSEIHRILKPNSIAIISSVMKYRIHDYPYDYWRFTPEAFKSLLKPFTSSFVGHVGETNFPHTVVGIGFKGQQPNMKKFDDQYILWHARQDPIHPSGRRPRMHFREFVKLFVPPILLHVKRKIATAIKNP